MYSLGLSIAAGIGVGANLLVLVFAYVWMRCTPEGPVRQFAGPKHTPSGLHMSVNVPFATSAFDGITPTVYPDAFDTPMAYEEPAEPGAYRDSLSREIPLKDEPA